MGWLLPNDLRRVAVLHGVVLGLGAVTLILTGLLFHAELWSPEDDLVDRTLYSTSTLLHGVVAVVLLVAPIPLVLGYHGAAADAGAAWRWTGVALVYVWLASLVWLGVELAAVETQGWVFAGDTPNHRYPLAWMVALGVLSLAALHAAASCARSVGWTSPRTWAVLAGTVGVVGVAGVAIARYAPAVAHGDLLWVATPSPLNVTGGGADLVARWAVALAPATLALWSLAGRGHELSARVLAGAALLGLGLAAWVDGLMLDDRVDVHLHDTAMTLVSVHALGAAVAMALLAMLAPRSPAPGRVGRLATASVAGSALLVWLVAQIALGRLGMPRRYWTYTNDLETWQRIGAIGAVVWLVASGVWLASAIHARLARRPPGDT